MASDALDGFSAGERARIGVLLVKVSKEEGVFLPPEPVGAIRRLVRWLLRLIGLAVLGLAGWHAYALASLPDKPFDAIHAPLALTIGSALAGMLFMLWFDGK